MNRSGTVTLAETVRVSPSARQHAVDEALEVDDVRHEDGFYVELLKFVSGEPCDIQPGTVGMIMAEIAESLVAHSPELVLPENRARFLREIGEVYDRAHAVKVSLDERDIALVTAIVNGEDTRIQ